MKNIEIYVVDILDVSEEKADPSDIRRRLMMVLKEYKFNSFAHLARSLGVKPATLSMWIKRGKMDINLLVANIPYISREFLETGLGKVRDL